MSPRVAPPGWKIGDPLTPEMRAHQAAARAKSKETRPHKPRPPRPQAPKRETAPVRAGVVTPKVRSKIVSLVSRMILGIDATLVWGARQITRPVYAVDPTTKKLLLDERKRPIIEARVRAVSDETLALDRLEDWERQWLAEELCDELIQYKRIRGFLMRLVELEERSSLPICLTIIALPRLARHNILPPEFLGMVEEMREAARKVRRAPKAEPLSPEPVRPEVPQIDTAAD